MSALLSPVHVTRSNFQQVASMIRGQVRNFSKSESLARRIVSEVRRKGDRAVLTYTRRFDGVGLQHNHLRISPDEIERSVERVSDEVRSALRVSLSRLEAVQKQLVERISYSSARNGFVVRAAPKPLSSVGCYIPGGRAAYASTMLMTAGLAKLAGVRRIVVCTPPDSRGMVNAAILAAARLCGVHEVYRIGGAQAIAALAYGTRTIPRVEKIVGPGGFYVALAKKIVSGDVAIDFFAGPTELIVVADERTDPKIAAWDLIAQAEHGEDTVCGLVTWSEDTAEKVRAEITRLVPRVSRRNFVVASLRQGFSAICSDRESACAFVNAFAPEHLELLVDGAGEVAEMIQAAGLTLLGSYAPCAASDYCVGTSHVLPTGGFASVRGGLSILDFVKLVWTVEGSREGLQSVLKPLRVLASSEGLRNHYLSAESRFGK